MENWGFWEWLTYGCIAVAALMLALDAAVKQSPDLNRRFGGLLAQRTWAFTPFLLILVSALIIAARHLTPSVDISRTERTTTRQTQLSESNNGQPAASTAKTNDDYRFPQGDLQSLSDEELRKDCYALSSEIEDFRHTYSRRYSDVEYSAKISPAEKADAFITIENELSKNFRSRFESDVFRAKLELNRRLRMAPPQLFSKSGNLSDTTIMFASDDVKRLAAQLP